LERAVPVRPFVAALIGATTLVALAAPAEAKVTKNPKDATHVLACNDGSGKTAMVWYNGYQDADAHPQANWKTWAVKNPCQRWLIIDAPGDSVSDPYGGALSVAPKTNFQSHDAPPSPDSDEALGVYLSPSPESCSYGYMLYQIGPKDHGHMRFIEDCPRAPWA
jgi:hypothetical protein